MKKELVILGALYALLNMLDLALTLYGLDRGASELNSIMRYMLENYLILLVFIKCFVPIILVTTLWALSMLKSLEKFNFRFVFRMLVAGMTLIISVNITTIILSYLT